MRALAVCNWATGQLAADLVSGESVFEDLDETEINRFLDWLERKLLIDDLDKRAA